MKTETHVPSYDVEALDDPLLNLLDSILSGNEEDEVTEVRPMFFPTPCASSTDDLGYVEDDVA